MNDGFTCKCLCILALQHCKITNHIISNTVSVMSKPRKCYHSDIGADLGDNEPKTKDHLRRCERASELSFSI